MITPTVIILLKLPFESGMSHPVKATSGSLIVSGCGRRYGNSVQYLTIPHFPSLHARAAPHGGIFTLADTTTSSSFFSVCFKCPVVCLSLLCFEARRFIPHAKAVGLSLPLDPTNVNPRTLRLDLIASITSILSPIHKRIGRCHLQHRNKIFK